MKARGEQKVGVYHGWNVISTSREEYWKRSEEGRTKGAYLIYDDNNALIYMGEYIGTIAANGNIINADKVRVYKDNRFTFEEKMKPKDHSEIVYTTPKVMETKGADLEILHTENGRTLADEIIDSVFGVEIDDMLWKLASNDASQEGDS